MKAIFIGGTAAALLLMLVACGQDNLAVVGLNVEIRDANTGAPLAYGATLIARTESFTDTVIGSEIFAGAENAEEVPSLVALIGRIGTADVTVTHPGYEPWYADGVVIRSGSRSPLDNSPQPTTTYITAELQPLQGSQP